MNPENEIFNIVLKDIMPNRFQPREMFDQKALEELAQSIKEHGVIQPIIVRKIGDKYEIVAGERRFRASQLAGQTTIPALVRTMDDKEVAKIALLENLQRQNLSAIEEAKTYNTILQLDNMTQEELAKDLGKSQSTIANKLRLLNLSEEVQAALLNEEISERHARSLLNLKDKNKQNEILTEVKAKRLTVKQLDDLIKKGNINPIPVTAPQTPNPIVNNVVTPEQVVEQPVINPQPAPVQTQETIMPRIQTNEIKQVQEPKQEIKHENNPFEKLRIYDPPVESLEIKQEEIPQNTKIKQTTGTQIALAEEPKQEIKQPTNQVPNNLYDSRFGINNVRQAVQNNIKFGVKTNVQEEDLGNSYKITIIIDK